MTTKYLVSTDVDGTLIDHHSYSYQAALPALRLCARLGVPVILNTSKTYQETVGLQRELGLTAPVIVENGSGLILPTENQPELPPFLPEDNSANCRLFGAMRSDLLAFIEGVRASYHWRFEGFNDWSVGELANLTGLEFADAERAKAKQFSEPFLWYDSDQSFKAFIGLVEQSGFQVLTGGRFHHLQGVTDKAKPLAWLLKSYGNGFAELASDQPSSPTLICLGDSQNDVAMLNFADVAVCVRSPVTDYPKLTTAKTTIYTEAYGPAGWAEAIVSLLDH